MVPLYAARIADLGPTTSSSSSDTERLSPAMMATAGVPEHAKVLDLQRRLKCRECRWKGRAVVSVRWLAER